jgi:hypothetical protein
MQEGVAGPPDQPAAMWQVADQPAAATADMTIPEQPPPSWASAGSEPLDVASEMPASPSTSAPPVDEHAAGAQSAIAVDAPQGHERDVTPSPKDLFGDVSDDVPPTPSGGLFDHNDGKGSPS